MRGLGFWKIAVLVCAFLFPATAYAGEEVGGGVGAYGLSSGAFPRDAPAPAGLIDFCRRQPGQCRSRGQDDIAVRRTLAEAGQVYWRQVFAGKNGGRAEAPGAVDRRGLPRAATMRSRSASLFLGVAPAALVPMGTEDWTLIQDVNREINRSILQTSDQRQFSVPDYWTIPVAAGPSRARGDCEDFVLAKRAALVARGIPAEALSIALVTTAWNEPHAVLLVSTDRGEYVMDNLEGRLLHWSAANLTWRSRQRPGEILRWIDLAGV